MVQVPLARLLDRYTRPTSLLDTSWLVQFRLALTDPGLGSLHPIEGLGFLIDCLTLFHGPDLHGIRCRSVLALALRDGSRGFAT